jgi:hypothetical protein
VNQKAKKVIACILILFTVGSSCIPVNHVSALTYDVADSTDSTNNSVDSTDETASVDYATTEDTDFDASQVKIQKEVSNLRTANSKTFLKVDGSYVVAIYNEVVHYEKNGKFYNVDNTLAADGDFYSNKANAFLVNFPKTIKDNKSIHLTMDEYQIDWSLCGISDAVASYTDVAEKSDDVKKLTKIRQSISYEGVQDGVDIEYIVNGSSVKENIILEHYVNNFSMSFVYSVKNLSLLEGDNGTYSFVNQDGKTIFELTDLIMYDSKENESSQIKISVIEIKKGEYEITITPSNEWLKTSSYPVTIDPTIHSVLQNISIEDTFVTNISSSTNYSTRTYMRISSDSPYSTNGLLKFTLPSVLSGKSVTYAYLTLT